jgi:hypothetical protein
MFLDLETAEVRLLDHAGGDFIPPHDAEGAA